MGRDLPFDMPHLGQRRPATGDDAAKIVVLVRRAQPRSTFSMRSHQRPAYTDRWSSFGWVGRQMMRVGPILPDDDPPILQATFELLEGLLRADISIG